MNARFENMLSMYYAVIDFCQKNKLVWQNDVPFKTSFDLFMSKIPLIEQNRNQQSINFSGVTKEKAQKKEELSEKAYFAANRLQSYARASQNFELLNKISFSKSNFMTVRDTDLIGMCNIIVDCLKQNLSQLGIYSISQVTIDELQLLLNIYQSFLGKPRSFQSSSITATANLSELFKETNEIIKNRLDLDVEVFKNSASDFYKGYASARKILKTNKSVLSLKVLVIDSINSKPISNVKVTFASANIEKKTTIKGNIQIKNFPAGNHELTLEKIGYVSSTHSFVVIDGETTDLTLEMEAV
jgi:hypothetical protein